VDPEIFISHSSTDQKVSRTICTALENRGLACWISSRDVKPGQNFQEQIVKAIRAAKIMVLVFTASANNSNEIKKELALASQNNLIVIPVRIEDVSPNEAFAYEFATRQWIDLFDNWESSIARLVELIAASLKDQPSGDGIAAVSLGRVAKPVGKSDNAATTADRHQTPPAKPAMRALPAVIAAACVAVLILAIVVYLKVIRPGAPQATNQPSPSPTVPAVVAQPKAPSQPAPPPPRQAEALVPETIPIVSDRVRDNIRKEYMLAPDHKALAISTGPIGFITGQPDDESAKTAALDMCQQRADTLKPPRHCDLYAVGTTIVYARGHAPMPPTPWFRSDPVIESPVTAQSIPILGDKAKEVIERSFVPGRKPKALAISSSGIFADYSNQDSADEAARRSLEVCGGIAGVACMIVAIDDNFVVPVPTTMKAVGFFRPAGVVVIAPELRDGVANRLANAGGWTAVAVGDSGKVGMAINAANEQTAIDGATNDCSKQDRACHVIAIGPFAVEPK
jgi:hypothetical protein